MLKGRPSRRRTVSAQGLSWPPPAWTGVKYDDHRRIRLPYLGSVKLQRELPEGIPYEVRIKQENGRWYASINYWKPPVGAEEKTHLCGAVDVGITPLAVDSGTGPLRESQSTVPDAR